MTQKTHNLSPWFPAVPIEESVRDNVVVCLECGEAKVLLKRHLKMEHGLDEAAYRARWRLSPDHPLAAPSYQRSKEAHLAKTRKGQG
ncbi:MucR family transcriptional regulator [Leisingera caerulea]|uniref:MucR family transcriptional regulator n=1 Tax=Leisingera caerulea TaxID=506591 RepID=UPI0003FE737F|nr:MucR family transcriptional regulator [Leisingera caerulea]